MVFTPFIHRIARRGEFVFFVRIRKTATISLFVLKYCDLGKKEFSSSPVEFSRMQGQNVKLD
ncbi:MAG: hypothetical protein DWI22_11085 [Planctomycetota bacterium]|nr:MAG: hypothetical protein DWI22_11085 [Planctomycetota bacterium]